MSFIYIWQNLNNFKIYVGQSVDPIGRRRGHIRRMFHETSYSHPLYDSMRHHGINNFKFEIIEEVSDEEIDDAEEFWIDFFRSWDREMGYNLERGGKRRAHVSETTRKKLSVARRGQQMAEATKEKLRQVHKGKQYRLGHTVTEETREKLRRSHLKLGPEVLELRDRRMSYDAIAKQSKVSFGAARNAVRYWTNIRSNAPGSN